ncbi:MAG: penicillin acylase family protein, partial [Thermoanaerobaculia bacterium]
MLKRLARAVLVTLLILFVLLAAAWFGGRSWLSRSVARHSGEFVVRGLDGPVEIGFDARGVPRIDAKTERDAAFALGWCHASERMFQMDLVRRLSRGELSEIFGDAAYETDVRQRQIGFGRRAAAAVPELSPAGRSILESYAAGVNAWITQASMLPPEFVLLRYDPRLWTIDDSLAVALYQTWYSHELMDVDETLQRIVEKVGPEIVPAIGGDYPWSPPTVSAPLAKLLGEQSFPLRATAASNSWVISPMRSASGKAIHASDPHLSIDRAPGLWYLASIHSADGLDVVGVTQPGLPFVVMGHNGAIAFAFTVASVDVIDYYDEDLAGAPKLLLARGASGWEPVVTRQELIVVKGEKEPRRLTVHETKRGPLMRRDGAKGVALHWAGFDRPLSKLVDGALALWRAKSFDEFRGAVTSFGALDANWVYSDRDGNIGYQLGVPIPVRSGGDGIQRRKGSDPNAAWPGYIELERTPHVLNPPQGWLASCNNQPVGSDWPYAIPGFYDPYRITRASALLEAKGRWSPAAVSKMQMELVSGRARRWKALAAEGAGTIGHDDVARRLSAWDGAMTTSSNEAALFAVWWYEMGRAIFEDELGSEWKDGRAIEEKVLGSNLAAVIDDRRTASRETAADISGRAMAKALEAVGTKSYGEMSTLRVAHPLARVAILDRWLSLSRGPIPLGGDPGSLNANFNSYDDETGMFHAHVGASMRYVLDWSDVDAFSIALALGQSGNPFSSHYDDFFEPSLRGEGWNVPFSKAKADERAVERMKLVPRGRREARGERREARGERREARGGRREAGGE